MAELKGLKRKGRGCSRSIYLTPEINLRLERLTAHYDVTYAELVSRLIDDHYVAVQASGEDLDAIRIAQ